jgi:F0F1-type ATP synthase membrane subunit c/vacuolar-type H+-ATPase subunit K
LKLSDIGIGALIGLAVGAGLGTALGNLPAGLALGVILCVGVGAFARSGDSIDGFGDDGDGGGDGD